MTSELQVSVTDARGQLADLVNRVAYTGEQVTLTRHGRPVAVLVSVADAERARGALAEEPSGAAVTLLAPRALHVPERPEQSLEIAARTTSAPPHAGGAPQPPAGRR
ncbi:MAG: type II toxin-antitoxin system Phd/YefM family antitoxin [Actinomycetes bacterium]